MSKIKEVAPLNKMLEEGIKNEVSHEVEVWNKRLFTTPEYKGGPLDRFPLSPSQIGKCGLALARNVSHYLGRANYPRSPEAISPRIQRIFARGHLLEEAMVGDIEKYTPFKIQERQKRLKLFPLGEDRFCEGNIDGLAYLEEGDVKVLLDFKSKGARYSANFSDSIQQFFQELRQTGLVQEIYENSFLINNAKALFDILSLDEFFVDYLLQLNGYAFGMREAGIKVDFVSLFYENKNTSAYYEIRWVPSKELLDYSSKKYNFIYSSVLALKEGHTDQELMDVVPKEFALGSPRCNLCEHKELCWGTYVPKNDAQKGRIFAVLDDSLDRAVTTALSDNLIAERAKEEVLVVMSQKDATHIQLKNGVVMERKYLKSPKPHYELRSSK